jgi:hypothetical protein
MAATKWEADQGELHGARVERKRGAWLGAQLSRGGRVSVGGLQKRLGRVGGVAEKRAVVGASTTESASGFGGGGRFRHAGPTEQRERRANGRSVLTSGAHGTERERGTHARGE